MHYLSISKILATTLGHTANYFWGKYSTTKCLNDKLSWPFAICLHLDYISTSKPPESSPSNYLKNCTLKSCEAAYSFYDRKRGFISHPILGLKHYVKFSSVRVVTLYFSSPFSSAQTHGEGDLWSINSYDPNMPGQERSSVWPLGTNSPNTEQLLWASVRWSMFYSWEPSILQHDIRATSIFVAGKSALC